MGDNLFNQKPQPQKAATPAPQPETQKATPAPAAQQQAQEAPHTPEVAAAAAAKYLESTGNTAMPVDQAAIARRTPEELSEIDMDVDTETRMLEIVRKRQHNKQELIKIAISQTNEEDWVLQGGKPYLEVTGAEKIAPIFSVSVKNIRYEKEIGMIEEGGKYVRHWYFGDGELSPNGHTVYRLTDLFGSSWTHDDFFGKNKDGSWKGIYEIDERDLRYKAYSDLMRVAVVRLLGLRSVSLDQLKAAGLNLEKIQGVDRGYTVAPEDKAKQAELFQIIKGLVGTDSAKVKAKVKELTWFEKTENGKVTEMFKENYDQLSGKWLEATLSKARKLKEAMENGGNSGVKK